MTGGMKVGPTTMRLLVAPTLTEPSRPYGAWLSRMARSQCELMSPTLPTAASAPGTKVNLTTAEPPIVPNSAASFSAVVAGCWLAPCCWNVAGVVGDAGGGGTGAVTWRTWVNDWIVFHWPPVARYCHSILVVIAVAVVMLAKIACRSAVV